jgi:hypothetical protein
MRMHFHSASRSRKSEKSMELMSRRFEFCSPTMFTL